MNRYHLEIITGDLSPHNFIQIEADDLDWSESGNYKFSNLVLKPDGNKRYQSIALYPISRTIISKIERDIETQN